ncbi:MAG TPA: 5-oxoprolinase subunit PxpA [Candidatus Eisenbacteria bacterium]|nr:5-oxoprolinase subunit PxpA [Candidatus Eisenbacteria bacterium]
MSNLWIDINSDLGESEESLANGTDFELMRFITSANVACGGHAGDERTMRETVRFAKELNVAVGAHPGYPDRANFGRIESPMAPTEIEATVRDQIAALAAVAETLGVRLVHCKPHGALYHAANKSAEVAAAIGRAVLESDEQLIMVGQAGSSTLTLWESMGLSCAAEAFADRAYEPDGILRKRTLPGALLDDPAKAARQALDIATRHIAVATDGSELTVAAATICIHSDTPGSVLIARAVNEALTQAGVRLRPLSAAGE